jgi:hypothetical protein
MEINKGSQLIGEPGERDLILASARLELLDPAIREIHVCLGSARARRDKAGVVVILRAGQSPDARAATVGPCAHLSSDHQHPPPTLAEHRVPLDKHLPSVI